MLRPNAHQSPAEEADFLASYDPNDYERLSVAVDVAIISVSDGRLSTLLTRRHEHPHRGRWALPGGFVRPDESLEQTAARVLRDKGGLSDVFLEQLYTFGDPRRDPRMRVVSVAYYALVAAQRLAGIAGPHDQVALARLRIPWEGETGGRIDALDTAARALPLAFDHADILGMAVKRLRGKLDYAPIGFELLGSTFTLLELRRVHEAVLGRRINKDSFRRRMLATGLLRATGRSQTRVEHRPAELYRFTRRSSS